MFHPCPSFQVTMFHPPPPPSHQCFTTNPFFWPMFHHKPLLLANVSPQTPSSGQCFTTNPFFWPCFTTNPFFWPCFTTNPFFWPMFHPPNPFLATFHPQPPLLATYPPPPTHLLFRPMFQHSNPPLRPHNVLKLLFPISYHKMSTLYCFPSETGVHNYSWKFKFNKEVYFFF